MNFMTYFVLRKQDQGSLYESMEGPHCPIAFLKLAMWVSSRHGSKLTLGEIEFNFLRNIVVSGTKPFTN